MAPLWIGTGRQSGIRVGNPIPDPESVSQPAPPPPGNPRRFPASALPVRGKTNRPALHTFKLPVLGRMWQQTWAGRIAQVTVNGDLPWPSP